MMTSLFGLSDEKPLTAADFEPGRIVSLWDMQRFDIISWSHLHTLLGRYTGIAFAAKILKPTLEALNVKHDECPWIDLPSVDMPSETLETIVELEKELTEKGFSASAASARDVIARLNQTQNRKTLAVLIPLLEQILHVYRCELEGRFALLLGPDEARYYEIDGTFLGQDITTQLPSLIEDAAEAGNCLALSRYTACVFHLMRIMESLVQEFATKVKATKKDGTPLDVKNEEWCQIEQAIKRALDLMPKGSLKEQHFASLASLSAVRAGLRNPTMHPKQTYTEEEAKVLIECVRLFVRAFSEIP